MADGFSETMTGVECGERDAELHECPNGVYLISGCNQGGHDGTSLDLGDALAWIRDNRPDVLTALGYVYVGKPLAKAE